MKEQMMKTKEYLSTFYKGTKGPTLDAIKYFVEELDHPEKKLKIVHLAGTNGKGSVCEMISTVLEQAGYKVGLFMSPHIVRFNERIRVNHQEILDEQFIAGYEVEIPVITFSNVPTVFFPVGINLDGDKKMGGRILDYYLRDVDAYEYYDFSLENPQAAQEARDVAARTAQILNIK